MTKDRIRQYADGAADNFFSYPPSARTKQNLIDEIASAISTVIDECDEELAARSER